MTESDWATCREAERMLSFLRERGRASDRKLRLFACAAWRALVAGQGPGPADALLAACARGESAADHPGTQPAQPHGLDWVVLLADAAEAALRTARLRHRRWGGSLGVRPSLLRDIFNPFRPAELDPALRTPTVIALAEAAYEERLLPAGTLDPARLAVLADALEEAGCANLDVLSHLRGAGPHVRGCWPVDLAAGRG